MAFPSQRIDTLRRNAQRPLNNHDSVAWLFNGRFNRYNRVVFVSAAFSAVPFEGGVFEGRPKNKSDINQWFNFLAVFEGSPSP